MNILRKQSIPLTCGMFSLNKMTYDYTFPLIMDPDVLLLQHGNVEGFDRMHFSDV